MAVRTEEGISDTTALHQASSATAEAPQPPLEVQNSVMQSAALKEQPWQEVRKGSKQAGSLDVPKGRSQAKFKQPSHPRRAQAISYHPTQASQRTLPPPKALKPESGVVPSSRNLPLRPPLTWTQSAQNPYMQGQGQGQGQGRAQSQSSQEETGKRLDNTPVTLPLEEQLALCQQQQWQQRESLQAQMFQVQEHHEQLQQLQAQVAQVQQEQRQQQEHLQAQLSQLQQQQQAQPQGAAPAAAMPYTLDELFHMFYYQPVSLLNTLHVHIQITKTASVATTSRHTLDHEGYGLRSLRDALPGLKLSLTHTDHFASDRATQRCDANAGHVSKRTCS